MCMHFVCMCICIHTYVNVRKSIGQYKSTYCVTESAISHRTGLIGSVNNGPDSSGPLTGMHGVSW